MARPRGSAIDGQSQKAEKCTKEGEGCGMSRTSRTSSHLIYNFSRLGHQLRSVFLLTREGYRANKRESLEPKKRSKFLNRVQPMIFRLGHVHLAKIDHFGATSYGSTGGSWS